ncbi:MAG: trypsin-like peptidase domain-containing protein [Candidatus Kerfeldbacteria bacterium]
MDIPPPIKPNQRASTQKVGVGTIALISLIIGGVSGGIFGAAASKGGLSHLFSSSSTVQSSVQNVNTTGTLSLQEDSSTVDVVKKASPAVVSVVAKKDYSKIFGNSSENQQYNNFFGFPFIQQQVPQGIQEIGAGSGFIISSDGIIMTNKHVATISGADQYTVVTNDGKNYDAKLLATDPTNDIAFMKIEAKDLPTIELGNSDNVQIGDTVIAIGNALGEYRNTVTKGIISGLARTITAGDSSGNSETLRNVIQTDAAINQGNSGGPLLNIAGQAIGINTAIDSQGQLVGFALPINIAKSDLESVKKSGKIERPYLGVRYSIITPQLKEANKLSTDYGALIVRGNTADELAVVPGSPADKAGITENDIILEVDGQKINEDNDLAQILSQKQIGQKVTLKVLSKSKEKTVEVILEARTQ